MTNFASQNNLSIDYIEAMRNFRMKNPGKHSVMKEVRDYAFITVGMFFYCIGWTVMLLPNNIYWGTGIPVNVSYFSINAVLMIFALRLLGLKFCVKTIYAVTTLTLMVSISQGLVGDMQFLHDEPFMVTVIGSIFCGMGVGMGLSAGGSTGGTDIIAAIINKYRDISLGQLLRAEELGESDVRLRRAVHRVVLCRSGGELNATLGAVLHHLRQIRGDRA